MIGKELKLCCLCNKAPICVIRNYGLKRHLHSSCTQFLFWEPYRKGGQQYEPKQLTFLEHLKLTKNVLHMIKGEFKLLGEEVKEKVTGDLPIVQPGENLL